MHHSALKEKVIRNTMGVTAIISLLALLGIVLFLFIEGFPLFTHYSVWDFLTGMLWYPTEDPGQFGILPLLAGSLAVTALSSLFAIPLGVFTAVYLTEVAHPTTRRFIKPFIELLAALPSVVLGFLGMVVLAPFIQTAFGADSGLNLLNASIVLTFMTVPTCLLYTSPSPRDCS